MKQSGRAVKLSVRETRINGLEEALINSYFFFSLGTVLKHSFSPSSPQLYHVVKQVYLSRDWQCLFMAFHVTKCYTVIYQCALSSYPY